MFRIIASLLISLAFINIAHAQDSYYIGIDINSISAGHDYVDDNSTSDSAEQQYDSNTSNDNLGINIGYKSPSWNDFFLNPEIFYDLIGTQALDDTGYLQQVTNAYGVKANLGYNLEENLGAYITIGYNAVSYKLSDDNVATDDTRGTASGMFFGIGTRYDVGKNSSIKIEYNAQKIDLDYNEAGMKEETDINMLKIGLAHHF